MAVSFVDIISQFRDKRKECTHVKMFRSLHPITAQKMEFSIKNFFSKCDQIRMKTADLVTLAEEILNEKLNFLLSLKCIASAFEDSYLKFISYLTFTLSYIFVQCKMTENRFYLTVKSFY